MSKLPTIFFNETAACAALALCAVVLAVLLARRAVLRKHTVTIRAVDLFAALFLLWGVLNIWLVKKCAVDIFSVYAWGAAAGCYAVVRGLPRKQIILYALVLSGVVQAGVAVLQQAGCLPSNHAWFAVTGTFKNPGHLGGYLSVCLSVSLCLLADALKNRQPKRMYGWLAACLLQGGALYLSDSRAGILGFLAGGMVVVLPAFKRLSRKYKIPVACAAGVLLLIAGAALYFHRPASANGRLLLWRVSAGMVADAPVFGHGVDAFAEKYMQYQAGYFAAHPDSPFVPVADNAAYPFNEFVHTLVAGGAVGLLVLCALLLAAFKARGQSRATPVFQAGLAAMVVFSFFSYPSKVFPLLACCAVLLGAIESRPVVVWHVRRWQCAVLALLLLWVPWQAVREYGYLRSLSVCMGELHRHPENTDNRQAMEAFYRRMKGNFTFNVHYFAWLETQPDGYRSEQVHDALPTCEGYCETGRHHAAAHNYGEAERFFRTAANMIPSRVLPHYYLWELYTETGNTAAAMETAQRICTLPVKRESLYVLKIRGKMRRYLRELRTKSGAGIYDL